MLETILLRGTKIPNKKHNQTLRPAPEQAELRTATLSPLGAENHSPEALCFSSTNKGSANTVSKTQRKRAWSGVGSGGHLKARGNELSCHQLNQSQRPRQFLSRSPKLTGHHTESRPLAARFGLRSRARSPVPAQKCPQCCRTLVGAGRGGGRPREHRPSELKRAARTLSQSEACAQPEAQPERRADTREHGGPPREAAGGPRRREGARLGEAGRRAPGERARTRPGRGRAGPPGGGGRRRPGR